MTGGRHRPLVTLAALYGSGGTVIGPRVAEILGVPYLDRGDSGARIGAGHRGQPEAAVIRSPVPMLSAPGVAEPGRPP
jgi:hypothetical protein